MSRFDQAKMLMRVKKIQKELQKQIITVEKGDGAVKVEITGEQKLKKVHIDNFRIYVQATNLFTITKYPGLDPEIINFDDRTQGIDAGVYPTIKQDMLGAQINF